MKENELVKKTSQEVSIPAINEKELKDYLLGSGTALSDQQFKLFCGIAKASNLNPFKREIYAIPYEKRFLNDKGQWESKTDISIVSGYQIYIERASSTGLLDGWEVDLHINGATIIIYRKDFSYPFKWSVDYDEFAKKDKQGNYIGSWKTMKKFMIKKVAIGQGFRLAFPSEMGGLPYLQEEMSSFQEGIIEEVKPQKTAEEIKAELEAEKGLNYIKYFEKLQNIKSLDELKIVYDEIKKLKFTKENGAELSEIVKSIKTGFEDKITEAEILAEASKNEKEAEEIYKQVFESEIVDMPL